MEPEQDSLKWITDAREPPAPSAEKSSWKKYLRALTAGEREQAEYRFREMATGSGQSRAVSHLAATASSQVDTAIGCEPSLFLVGQVRPLALERLIRNRRLVTT